MWWVRLALFLGALAWTSAFAQELCVGDCNNDRAVTVDEIITMVNISLGSGTLSACAAGDANRDNAVTVDEIVTAVNNALRSDRACAPVAVSSIPYSCPCPLLRSGTGVIPADVDRDGVVDLVTGPQAILYGNGDATFQPQRNFSPDPSIRGDGLLGDANGDRLVDLLAYNVLYAGQPDGFAPFVALGPGEVFARALTDLNTDGKMDLIRQISGSLDFRLGDGSRQVFGFAAKRFYTGTALGPVPPVAEDLNGDGRLDFVLVEPSSQPGEIVVFVIATPDPENPIVTKVELLDGNPFFNSVTSLAVGDVDGNGTLDVLAGIDRGGIITLLGDGRGAFTNRGTMSVATRPIPYLRRKRGTPTRPTRRPRLQIPRGRWSPFRKRA